MYVGQFSYELIGPVDLSALREAWHRTAARHAALRTGVLWREVDRPLQIVRRRAEIPWTIEDWREGTNAARSARFAELLERDRERGFDLSVAPLLRLALFRVAEDRHLFLWSFHQMAFDGWSLPIVLNEATAIYRGLVAGRVPDLPEPRPFRDYIAHLATLEIDAAEPFWRRELAGFWAPTPLPFDRPPGGEGGFDECRGKLSAAVRTALEAAARGHRLTLNTLAQGAWGLLAARLSGEEDVLFGATVSGRPPALDGVEEMVGMFLNTLPVRVDATPERQIGAWLKELQERQVEVRQWEHAPLFQIQRWSAVPVGQPLFTSVLVFENYPEIDANEEGAAPIGELAVGEMKVAEQANFPVVLSVEADLVLLLNYDASRLDRTTAERILAGFENLLSGLPAALAGGRLADLDSLSAAERHQLRFEWNDTEGDGAPPLPVHRALQQVASGRPEASAIECGADRLTFADLDARAERLARRLADSDVAPGSRIAVCLDRSPDLVAAILAVWKSGCVYVPLDPSYPKDRLAFLLEDCAASLLLATAETDAVLPAHGVRTLRLDALAERGAAAPRFDRPCADSDLAYLIYTSGTTGRPKAVMIEHGQLAHTLDAARGRFDFRADDRMLHLASFSFDISLFELFAPLLAGASVHLMRRDEILDPEALVAALERASLVHTVPSLMRQILDRLEAIGRLASPPGPRGAGLPIRGLFVGGDAVPRELLAGMREAFPAAWIEVLYGPTEATIICAHQRATVGDGVGQIAGSAIGRPLPGVDLRVLDRRGRPAPIGVPGELWIGGPGVARGYLGRDELTRERFVVLNEREGRRWYRSGDRVRCRPDGALEFLGRVDEQVKIRGFRVELGEIEARLAAHPEVRDAVVAARTEGSENRLVAYLVLVPEAVATPADLRRFVQETLPDYMVPSAFVVLDTLPLSPTGKVDRRALPAPGTTERSTLEAAFMAPASPLEGRLAAIWAEVLGREVGRHDNFFELGGDSILSLQISSRAHRAGMPLSPKQLFQNPTVAELAAVLAAGGGTVGEQGPVVGPVPLAPIQRRFFDLEPADPHWFNLPLLLEARRRIAPDVAARVFAAVLDHHDALRARFARTEEGWVQSFAPSGGPPPVGVYDLSALPEARRSAEIETLAGRLGASLDLGRGPLARLAMFDLGTDVAGRLLLVFHHLVTDEISIQLLLEDLEQAFMQASRGEAIVLPLKTTSFREWTERLTAHARSTEIAAESAYWLASERDLAVPLPVDGNTGEDLEAAADFVRVALSREETEALLREVPRVHRTEAQEAILAAAVTAIARFSGAGLVLIDLEGHGREDLFVGVNLSRTVGWFTAVYPVLFDVRETLAPREALRAVRDALRAVPGRGVGYGLLRYLGPEETAERLRRQPPAEVVFNYRGQADAEGGEGAAAAPAVFGLAAESAGADMGPKALRHHRLEIDGGVEGGELAFTWSFGPARLRRETVERIAADFLLSLRAILAHCVSTDGAEPARAEDFPLAKLDDAQFEQLGSLLAEIDSLD